MSRLRRALGGVRAVAIVTLVVAATAGTLVRLGLPGWSTVITSVALGLAVASGQALRLLSPGPVMPPAGDRSAPPAPPQAETVDLTRFLEPAPIRRPQCPACGGHDVQHRGSRYRCQRCTARWTWRSSEPHPRITTRPKVSDSHV